MRIVQFGENEFAVEETTKFLFWEIGMCRYYYVPEIYTDDWDKIYDYSLQLKPSEDVFPVSDIEHCREFIKRYKHAQYKKQMVKKQNEKREQYFRDNKKVVK